MCKQVLEGQAPPAENTPEVTAGKKTELEKQLESAGDDPAKLKEITTRALAALSSTRKEDAARRVKNKELSTKLEKLEQAEQKREREKLSDLERAQAEAEEYQRLLNEQKTRTAELEARSHFSKAIDPTDLLLRWKALPEEERTATTPEDWAKGMEESASHLFKAPAPAPPAGPSPLGEGGGSSEITPSVNMHPANQQEAEAVVNDFYKKFG